MKIEGPKSFLLESAPTLERASLPDQLAEALRQRILGGELLAGAQLRQEALAQSYGVSRIPLREALRRLEAEGLVTLVPHKGAVVSQLSSGEALELFEMRALLESELLRHAVPHLGPSEIKRARQALDRYDAALKENDVRLWGELNWAFHGALYEAANRPRWLDEVRTLNLQTDRYIRLQLALSGALERARSEHEEILRLAEAGQAEAAAKAVGDHILAAGQVLARQLSEPKGEKKAK